MALWSDILKELNDFNEKNKRPGFDEIRRKYLNELYKITSRNTIFYATSWIDPKNHPGTDINVSDIQGFMEVVGELQGDELDLILHSPGGSAEATEAILNYLRTKFKDIRVIIPFAAMSAATMLSCGANSILMGEHSHIGPIDPQIVVRTQLGTQLIPAQAILDQFDMARRRDICASVWFPILYQYGISCTCKNAQIFQKCSLRMAIKICSMEIESNLKQKIKRFRLLSNHRHLKHSDLLIEMKREKMG